MYGVTEEAVRGAGVKHASPLYLYRCMKNDTDKRLCKPFTKSKYWIDTFPENAFSLPNYEGPEILSTSLDSA